MRSNPRLDAVAAELEHAGIRDYVGHVHVRWIYGGGEVRLVVVSRPPSGPGPRHARGDVRRLLRLDELIAGRSGDEPRCERS